MEYREPVIRRMLSLIVLAIACLLPANPVSAAAGFPSARPIADPYTASRAAYGRIDQPGQVTYFVVTPSREVAVTFEAVVPVRPASAGFRPTVAVLRPEQSVHDPVPFPVPAGYGSQVIPPDRSEPRRTLFDPNSIERFYRNASATVSLPGQRTTYVAVYDPAGGTGDYVLGAASSAHYENASWADLLAQGLALKFGAAPGRLLPWWDVFATTLAILASVVAGLVALGVLLPRPRAVRRNRLWQRWLALGGFGSVLVFYAGLRILNRTTGMIAVATFQEVLAVLLFLAALWLAVQPADRPVRRDRIFVALWGIGWLAEIALLAWYLLVTRLT